MGHLAPLRRLGRSRRDFRPDLGCAAPLCLQRLHHGRWQPALARPWHAQARARHGCRGDRRALRRQPLRAGAIDGSRAPGADLAHAGSGAGACCRRLSGMARRLPGAGLRRGSRGGSHRDGEPRAAGPARQHAQSQAREGTGIVGASRRQADAVVADRPAHHPRRGRAQSRHPCRGGFHQGRHRGPGRNSPRCSRRQSPASR